MNHTLSNMSLVAQSDLGLGLFAVKMKQPMNSLVIVSAEAEVALLYINSVSCYRHASALTSKKPHATTAKSFGFPHQAVMRSQSFYDF